jgi:hypothetical protein
MKPFTTEIQSHGENEHNKDPRTSPIIGAAIEVHRTLGRDSWNRRMKSAYATSFTCSESASDVKLNYPWSTKESSWSVATGLT